MHRLLKDRECEEYLKAIKEMVAEAVNLDASQIRKIITLEEFVFEKHPDPKAVASWWAAHAPRVFSRWTREMLEAMYDSLDSDKLDAKGHAFYVGSCVVENGERWDFCGVHLEPSDIRLAEKDEAAPGDDAREKRLAAFVIKPHHVPRTNKKCG